MYMTWHNTWLFDTRALSAVWKHH